MSFLKQRDFLTAFGWSAFFERQLDSEILDSEKHLIARVVGEEKELYRVQIDFGRACLAHVPGRFRYLAEGREDYPAVGDWVICRADVAALAASNDSGDQRDRLIIESILPRQTCLARKAVGEGAEMQIIAANVTQVFIAMSLNHDFSENRLERYLAITHESGAQPILCLTKADACEVDDARIEAVIGRHADLAVLLTSVFDPNSLAELERWIQPGSTSVFVGSSGVGKSSLLNHVLGGQVLKTQAIREEDSKGRQTTTARYLFEAKGGGLVIDTPGMREIGLYSDGESLSGQFGDIARLQVACHFTDCQHQTEPGCAILAALESGELNESHWANFQKFQKELQFLARKKDVALQAEERKKWKKIHVAHRERKKLTGR